MTEYQGKTKSIMGLGITIGVLSAIILFILIIVGVRGLTIVIAVLFALLISFLYKGMVLKITVDKEKILIYKPLGKKTIKFSNIAFCMVYGIDETESIIYAFVKKRIGHKTGVKGVRQKLSFEEIVMKINSSYENVDLDINFNLADKIPVSLVQKSEALKNEILTTLSSHQKRILNNI